MYIVKCFQRNLIINILFSVVTRTVLTKLTLRIYVVLKKVLVTNSLNLHAWLEDEMKMMKC